MRATALVCALTACAWCAWGQEVNIICQHNGNLVYGTHYTISGPPEDAVRILVGVQGETFEFEALLLEDPNDPNTYVGPGDVNGITADPNAGPVTISVVGHNGHEFGARDIGAIDLDAAGVTGTIAALNISRDFGALGPLRAGAAAALTFGHDVLSSVEVSGPISGPVVIAGTLDAELDCGALTDLDVAATTSNAEFEIHSSFEPGIGEINVNGPLNRLWIWGSVRAPMTLGDVAYMLIGGTIEPPPEMLVTIGNVGLAEMIAVTGKLKTGDLHGPFTVVEDVTGTIEVSGEAHSALWISGSLTGRLEVEILSGTIQLEHASSGAVEIANMELGIVRTVHDDFAGRIVVHNTTGGAAFWIGFRPNGTPMYADLTGSIEVKSSDDGLIMVYLSGALDDPYDPEIPGSLPLSGGYVMLPSYCGAADLQGGLAGSTEFFTVNYDAGVPYHSWCTDAEVIVAGTTCSGNTPGARVWESSPWKADMNGDHAVGFLDINPFVMAVSDPMAYSLAYPGLGGVANDPYHPDYTGGGRVWHGDLNCDGELNFADINPFVAFLSDPCLKHDCNPCPDEALLGDPGATAALLAANVDTAWRPALVELVAGYLAQETDKPTRAYWQAVLAALAE